MSRWYDAGRQGAAGGIFRAGNVGAAVTKFVAQFVMVAHRWHGVAHAWAAGLALISALFFLIAKDDPALFERALDLRPASQAEQFAPLRNL